MFSGPIPIFTRSTPFGGLGAALLSLLLLSACSSQPQVPDTRMDGLFDDWPSEPAHTDPVGDVDPAAAVDLGRVWVQDDPRFLYLSFETGRDVNVQVAPGTFRISLDADGDADTGTLLDGVPGADLLVELSHRPEGAERGAGMRVFTTASGQDSAGIDGYGLDLIAAPTHSASRFEVRIARARTVEGEPGPALTADSVRVGLRFVDSAGRIDSIPPTAHGFVTRAVLGPRLPDNRFVHPRQGLTRVVQWNVAGQSFRDHPDAFARIVASLDAGIAVLDELPGDASIEELQQFFHRAEFDGQDGWAVVLGHSGGRQKVAVASVHPTEPADALLNLQYDPDSLQVLRALGDSTWRSYLDRETADGLSVSGAWVTIQDLPTLIVGVDFQSRGWDGSPFDRVREVQASMVMAAVREELSTRSGPTGLVVAGDLNLVGSRRPLDALVAGARPRHTLTPAPAYHGNDQSNVTWRSPVWTPEFTPGRLDYVLVDDQAFRIERALVFDAGALSEGRRALMEVAPLPDDSRSTSDHLPLVVDVARQDRTGDDARPPGN